MEVWPPNPNRENPSSVWLPVKYFKIIVWYERGSRQVVCLLFDIFTPCKVTPISDISIINARTHLQFSLVCGTYTAAAGFVEVNEELVVTEQSAGGTCTASSPFITKIETSVKVNG